MTRYYLAFEAELVWEPPTTRENGVLLNSEEIDKFVVEWATSYGFSEKTIENGETNTFFVEFSDKELHNGEIDVQFGLRAIDQAGLQSDPAFYTLTLSIDGRNVGQSANVPLHDSLALILFIIFYGVVSLTRH